LPDQQQSKNTKAETQSRKAQKQKPTATTEKERTENGH
jgi:hypothetical protein